VLLDERREPAQQAGPVGGSKRSPGRERRTSASDRRVGFLHAGLVEPGDGFLRRRVDQGQGHALI